MQIVDCPNKNKLPKWTAQIKYRLVVTGRPIIFDYFNIH